MLDLVPVLRAARARIQGPDLHRNLVDLTKVRNLRLDQGVASFDLVLTTDACPMEPQLGDRCQAVAPSVPDVTSAQIAGER